MSVLSVIRGAHIERVYDDAGSWVLKLDVKAALQQGNQDLLREGVFTSEPQNDEEGWMGEELPASLGDDSDSEFSGFRVSFQCVSDACDSVLAEMRADPRTGLAGTAVIEHREIDDLVVTASRLGKIESLELKQSVEWLQDADTLISGRLIVDQVQGTSIQSLRAWAQILPLGTNAVFKRNAPRADEDFTQRLEYFVRKVGVRMYTDVENKRTSEELFFSDYSPKTATSSAKWVPGEVGLEPDPKSGRLRIRLKAHSSSSPDAQGVLILNFRGERLLNAPLSQ